jgi:hypothetical protein
LREGEIFKNPGLDGRIILKWIFEKWYMMHGLNQSGSGQGQVAGPDECSNES